MTKYLSIKSVLMISLFIILLIPSLMISIPTINMLNLNTKKEIIKNNESLAQYISVNIYRKLIEHIKHLDFLKNVMEKDAQHIQDTIDLSIMVFKDMTSIQILDKDGVIKKISPDNINLKGLDMSGQNYFIKDWGEKKFHITTQYISPTTDIPIVTVSVPHEEGSIVSFIDLSIFYEELRKISVNKKKHIGVIDSNGVYILHSDISNVYEKVSVKRRDFVNKLSNEDYSYTIEELEETPMLISTSPVELSDWDVAVYEPLHMIFEPLNKIMNALLLAVILAVLLVLISSTILSNVISQKISILTHVSNKVTKGDYTANIKDYSYYKELNKLADNINIMVKSIKEREAHIKSSSEKFRIVLDATNDGLWDWDLKKNEFEVSPKFYLMLGYKKGDMEFNYDNMINLTHPDDFQKLEKTTTDYLQGKRDRFEAMFRLKTADGKWKWILSRAKTASYDESGQPNRLIGMNIDISSQIEMEKKYRESKERFSRIAENAKDVIYRISLLNGEMEYINSAVYQITGYKPEDFYKNKKLIKKILHPEWEERFSQFWDAMINGNTKSFPEFKIIDKYGQEKWLNQRIVPVLNESGKAIAVEGIVTDYTDKKLADEELKWELNINKSIAGLSGLLIAENTSVEEISDNISKSLKELTKCEEAVLTYIVENKNGEKVCYTLSSNNPNPRKYDLEHNHYFNKNDDGKYDNIRAYSLETLKAFYTNESNQEEENNINETETTKGFNNLLSAPAVINNKAIGLITLLNCENGFDDKDLDIACRFADLYSLFLHRKRIEKALTNLNLELENKVLDRTKKLNSLNDELIQANRELTATNTKLKDTLEKLQDTQKRLIDSEKMAVIGELVAGVAHEINTPLGICVTLSSHLEEKTNRLYNDYQTESLDFKYLDHYVNTVFESSKMLMRNLKRASDLVNSFQQLAIDQSIEEMRTFNICEYINNTLISLKPKLKRTKHRINVNCGIHDNIQIQSYPGAFSQIITNLINNSLMHGFENIESGEIDISLSENKNNIYITYTDNGKGLKKDIYEKIYEPFFTTKREEGGTGLGMNIIYNIVNFKLNGSIEINSEYGKGFEIKIRIPKNIKTGDGL